MPKTIVIISGQMRSFSDCIASQRWQIFRRLESPEFYISCANDEQAKDAELLSEILPGR